MTTLTAVIINLKVFIVSKYLREIAVIVTFRAGIGTVVTALSGGVTISARCRLPVVISLIVTSRAVKTVYFF